MKRSGMGAGSWVDSGLFLPSVLQLLRHQETLQTPRSPRRYLQVTGAWSKSPNLLWNFLQVLQSKTSGFFRWLKQPEPGRAQAPQRESTRCCLLHPWHFRTGCREQKHLVGLPRGLGAADTSGMWGADPEVPRARSCSGFGTRLCWGFHSNLHLHLASGHRCNSARSWPSQASAGVRGGGCGGRGGAGS